MPKKYRDLASRAAWTALQAALGLVTVKVLDVPVAYAPVVATALSSLKSWVATKVGNPDTVTFREPPSSGPSGGPRVAPPSSGTLRARAGQRNPIRDVRPI